MPLDFINDLEDKLERLIAKLNSLRQENEDLKESLSSKELEIKELQDEKNGLSAAAESAQTDGAEQKQKLDEAAKRIAGLISKLEAVA